MRPAELRGRTHIVEPAWSARDDRFPRLTAYPLIWVIAAMSWAALGAIIAMLCGWWP